MMNEPMIVVYEINGEFWRDPFDPFWNHMGYHSHSGNGCGGSGFGWMHDSSTTVNLSGTALVDTTFMQAMYYLDDNNDGQPDYFLNFGPWWYEPNSSAVRPNDGDNITIVGGQLNREFLPMVFVYEINGLFWRDSTSLGHHFGGGWIHRNMNQSHQFNSPFDSEDKMTFNPGWHQMGGHGGHGGMMTDSMFCQIFETTPELLPNSSTQNVFAAYEVDIYQNNGMNGNHHNGNCGGHMHFNSNVNFQLHYNDEQISGLNENSLSVKYWDNETSNWVAYSNISINTSDNTVSFSTSDLSNFIILNADNATGVEDKNISVTDYELEQNYPNPFNPSTTISFNIPVNDFVNLTVFNIIGEKVNTLVNSYLEEGSHSITFDASKLTSGIYFYKLQSGNFNSTRKMLLIK